MAITIIYKNPMQVGLYSVYFNYKPPECGMWMPTTSSWSLKLVTMESE